MWHNSDYSSAIKQAEKIIGYPTSFLNLRWIINDEIANIATHIRRLLASKHPLLKSARLLLLNTGVPSWGLIILLLSKMVPCKSETATCLHDSRSGILHSQRVLAEVVEMLRTSNVIHKGIMSSNNKLKNVIDDSIQFGNKMSILSGDYLLAKSFKELSLLRDCYLHELMSSGVRDMTEAQFLGIRDDDNNPLPSKPNSKQEDIEIPNCFDPGTMIDSRIFLGHMKSEWKLRTILDGGHLLARACQSTVHLSRQSDDIQKHAYEIARNFVLFSQVYVDIKGIKDDKFSLVSAPVMLHLENYPELHEELIVEKNDVNYDKIRKLIYDKNAMEKSYDLKNRLFKSTIELIKEFPKTDAGDALINILSYINKSN